jgi:hypothetical protein
MKLGGMRNVLQFYTRSLTCQHSHGNVLYVGLSSACVFHLPHPTYRDLPQYHTFNNHNVHALLNNLNAIDNSIVLKHKFNDNKRAHHNLYTCTHTHSITVIYIHSTIICTHSNTHSQTHCPPDNTNADFQGKETQQTVTEKKRNYKYK